MTRREVEALMEALKEPRGYLTRPQARQVCAALLHAMEFYDCEGRRCLCCGCCPLADWEEHARKAMPVCESGSSLFACNPEFVADVCEALLHSMDDHLGQSWGNCMDLENCPLRDWVPE